MLLLVGLIALVQGVVYVLVSQASQRSAMEHIRQNLGVGARVFQQSLQERIETLSTGARLMAEDYAIKPLLMREPDVATLRSTLYSFTTRVGSDLISLFTAEGDFLASTDPKLRPEELAPFRQLIDTATQSDLERASGYAVLHGQLQVLVVVPLYAPRPQVAAWFGLAYPIDRAFAQKIQEVSQLEVTFLSGAVTEDPRVLATTVAAPGGAELSAAFATATVDAVAADGTTSLVRLAGEPYVTRFEPLPRLDGGPIRIALQRSLTAELAPARALERVVLGIALAALLAASLAAWSLAREVSRPVQALAAHTGRVGRGDYTARITLDRDDELGQLATAFNDMTAGLAERDRVRDLLGKVVSPEIAAQLLRSGVALGGEDRVVTILFCDLRNFTGQSERMPPQEALALLNRYLDRMSTIIEAHGGVIDKYIGDAIMALFGAPVPHPRAADQAVATARAMVTALTGLNRDLAAEGRAPLAFGIGINTAEVVAGNMGSKTRLNYTVIGDGVNLASRLESLTREPSYATSVILSDATVQALSQPASTRPLGRVTVKGKAEPVQIHALD
jgi:adenylate cyclase